MRLKSSVRSSWACPPNVGVAYSPCSNFTRSMVSQSNGPITNLHRNCMFKSISYRCCTFFVWDFLVTWLPNQISGNWLDINIESHMIEEMLIYRTAWVYSGSCQLLTCIAFLQRKGRPYSTCTVLGPGRPTLSRGSEIRFSYIYLCAYGIEREPCNANTGP